MKRNGLVYHAVLMTGIIALIVVFSGVAPTEAKTIELKQQLFHPPTHFMTKIITTQLAPWVEKMTEGRVKIKVYPHGTLVKPQDMLISVQKKIIDIGHYNYTSAPYKSEPFSFVGCLPGEYRDAAGLIDAFSREDTLNKLVEGYLNELGYDNVDVKFTNYWGFQRFGFRNKEPKTLEDIGKLKVRSVGMGIYLSHKYWGIDAVSTPTGEAYEALERGMIDGSTGVLSNFTAWKWMEPMTYLFDHNLYPASACVIMSRAAYAKLSKTDKAIVDVYFKWLGDVYAKEYLKVDVVNNEIVKKHMKFYSPTPEVAADIDARSAKFVEEWLEKTGERGKKALEVIKKYNKK